MILQITLATRTEGVHSDDAMKTENLRCDFIQELTKVMHPIIFISPPVSILTQYFRLRIFTVCFIKYQQLFFV